jgi:hypothetical protein
MATLRIAHPKAINKENHRGEQRHIQDGDHHHNRETDGDHDYHGSAEQQDRRAEEGL